MSCRAGRRARARPRTSSSSTDLPTASLKKSSPARALWKKARATVRRSNYYFQACRAVCVSGSAVALPVGHGIVSLSDSADRELVFLPESQLELELVPGEIGRLERAGLAERIGSVR